MKIVDVIWRKPVLTYAISAHVLIVVLIRQRMSSFHFYRATRIHSVDYAVARCLSVCLSHAGIVSHHSSFLSASLYFSKRGTYWDRLCRDVVGRLSRACTVAKRCILGNPTPGIQWYNFRPPGVTPNRAMGPPWGAFCQVTLTSCFPRDTMHKRGLSVTPDQFFRL